MARIFVTRKLPGHALEEWAKERQHEITIFQEDRPISREELEKAIQETDILICLLSDKIDQELIEQAPHLKIIANYAVGYNNIDTDWATYKDIAILNTPDVLTDATADLAMALLLAAARRLPEGEKLIRRGEWQGWAPKLLLGLQVTGKRLGIIGLGRIGQAFAKRAKAFSMTITYHNRQRVPAGIERELGAQWLPLEELLSTSDIISLHCPLTPETHHLINAKTLSLMKKGTLLINTARGPIIDENALVEALQSEHLLAAGLDVYEKEPEIHPELLKLDNVVLAPHLGTSTTETRLKMVDLLIKGIDEILGFRYPTNLINPEILPNLRKKLQDS